MSTVQQSSPKLFASKVPRRRKSATLKRGYQIIKSKHRLFQKQLEKGMKSIASNITKKNEDKIARYAAHQIGVDRQIIQPGNNRKNR